MLDPNRFQRCWYSAGAKDSAEGLFGELAEAYAQPHRAYHTARHIAECLAEWERVAHLADRPTELELAIWFHDAVYDPRAGDNEARSGAWARGAIVAGGAAEAIAAGVEELILATAHTAAPVGRDVQLIVDVDLAILGQPPARFDEYDRQIRQEYAWVPEPEYRQARAAILTGFIERQSLYHTPEFQQRYEHAARENLCRAVERLGDPNFRIES